ncbi:MAG: amidohydrolase family protein [Chthonomonadaceae bacterium]|nr:amidohydrolase family protein [Chthonomonadaceae bacterium]
MIPVIDTHQHLWKMSQFSRPWIGGVLARDFTLEDYRVETDGLNFEATIYVETGVVPEERNDEARWILELQRQEKSIAGTVIGGDPSSPHFADTIRAFTSYPGLKGVRPAINRSPGQFPLLNEPFLEAMRLLGNHDLCCDLLVSRDDLLEVAVLAQRHPETRFVLDHCGDPGSTSETRDVWGRNLAMLAHCPNVFCKISGIVGAVPSGASPQESLAPIILHCAETFGAERLLFGSDWPVLTPHASIAEWKSLLNALISGWSDEDKHRLYHDNAVRVYRLA